jgi:hypothetical protein
MWLVENPTREEPNTRSLHDQGVCLLMESLLHRDTTRIDSTADYAFQFENDEMALLRAIKQRALKFQDDKFDVAIVNQGRLDHNNQVRIEGFLASPGRHLGS